MNILLLGYGKMGKIIGEIAESRGHHIAAKINIDNRHELEQLNAEVIDVAIEFSQPNAAFDNISWAIKKGIPVVSGTTGWLDKKPEVEKLTKENDTAFFYASNFSVGVNIFFKVNKFLAGLMKDQSDYKVSLEEIHHTEKRMLQAGQQSLWQKVSLTEYLGYKIGKCPMIFTKPNSLFPSLPKELTLPPAHISYAINLK